MRQIELFDPIPGFDALICGEQMCRLFEMVQRVAHTPAAVLITGETGSGKELVARALHHYSLRCTRPWVDVNCGSLPNHLVESELFGYEKGAFSGANAPKPGLFEVAHTGTLLLDEIGELEFKAQVKLLRVLDGVPYYRLGGTRHVTADVRILASTAANLEEAVEQGTFRRDLFYRLNQIHIKVPPLRERIEAIPELAKFFLQKHDSRYSFSEDALAALQAYSWPGNVRELRNIAIKSAVCASGFTIAPSDLPAEVHGLAAISTPAAGSIGGLDELEREMIKQTLSRTGGSHQSTAKILGISTRTLARKLKLYEQC